MYFYFHICPTKNNYSKITVSFDAYKIIKITNNVKKVYYGQ